MERTDFIIGPDDPILVTGAAGFIGSRVIGGLLDRGFRRIRAFVRRATDTAKIDALCASRRDGARIEIIGGNLLSREDCMSATKDVAIVFHLAAARGEKSFPDAFMNSVVTTRNLIEAAARTGRLRRFVSISSFAVYTNTHKARRCVLDESCPIEQQAALRGDAYCFAKVKQDELVNNYCSQLRIPYVIVRPGHVYGPGNEDITARVGIGTFGLFLHLGGNNTIPLTYVDNCADAIVLAGLTPGVDGEVFNVVDDDLPTSRRFLRLYKASVRPLPSLYLPHVVSYGLCWGWERYSRWSEQQIPPVYNRRRWHAQWKRTRYSNARLKSRVGWAPRISTAEGLTRYFQSCRARARHA